jgi:23S rRNA (adenine-N6)-dimethyltransferase
VGEGDLVLDLGAGTGAITHHLLLAGARVVAFELHPQRAAQLRARFATTLGVKVVQADVSDLWLPHRPFRVVSNPPFATTAAVLRRLLAPSSQLVRADLVVPRYLAARWAAGRGLDARRWTGRFEVTMAMRIPRDAFRPAAPDGAAVLTITRRRYDRRGPHPRSALGSAEAAHSARNADTSGEVRPVGRGLAG